MTEESLDKLSRRHRTCDTSRTTGNTHTHNCQLNRCGMQILAVVASYPCRSGTKSPFRAGHKHQLSNNNKNASMQHHEQYCTTLALMSSWSVPHAQSAGGIGWARGTQVCRPCVRTDVAANWTSLHFTVPSSCLRLFLYAYPDWSLLPPSLHLLLRYFTFLFFLSRFFSHLYLLSFCYPRCFSSFSFSFSSFRLSVFTLLLINFSSIFLFNYFLFLLSIIFIHLSVLLNN